MTDLTGFPIPTVPAGALASKNEVDPGDLSAAVPGWIGGNATVQGAFAFIGSSPPGSPYPGQRWLDSDTGVLAFWTGSEWVEVAASGLDLPSIAQDPAFTAQFAPLQVIASTVLVGSGSVTFSAIPATFNSLRILINGRMTAAGGVALRFNNDTGNNYGWAAQEYRGGTGPTRLDNSSVATSSISVCAGSDLGPMTAAIDIPGYVDTTFAKALVSSHFYVSTEPSVRIRQSGGWWNSTAAINRIDLGLIANMAIGTRVTILGVK